jgi:hypothetical protein
MATEMKALQRNYNTVSCRVSEVVYLLLFHGHMSHLLIKTVSLQSRAISVPTEG